MTPERLAQIEEAIRRPSSASLPSEWLLELVDAVKRLSVVPVVVPAVLPIDAELKPGHVITVGARPTPPPPAVTPAAAPHAKKKGAK